MSYRLEVINKKGNYIRVETTIKNNKNYLNQQLKQHKPTTFRSNQLPRAARKTMHGVNKYINPNKKNRSLGKRERFFVAIMILQIFN